MINENNFIKEKDTLKSALEKLNKVPDTLTLFVIDENDRLVGTITDGDIRRALLKEASLSDAAGVCMNRNFRSITKGNYDISMIKNFKSLRMRLVPLLDEKGKIINIYDLNLKKSILPIDAVIMAGGRGSRLSPLTDTTPKPLLKVGAKPIIEHNVDRLSQYGVFNFYISIRYLGQQISDYFNNGKEKNISIKYIDEDQALGTIGAVSKIDDFSSNCVLIMNSDLLTNVDFEDFYTSFIEKDADMAIAAIPYQVQIPYAVLEIDQDCIKAFKEKPTYTYYSNAGIYLIKKEHLSIIPKSTFFDATDLIEKLITLKKKVIYYSILGYWLDIGKPEDYQKAQEDIKHLGL